MDSEKVIKLKIENKKISKPVEQKPVLQTNPIMQKMLNCNALTERMKFKLKDLFK